MNRYDIALGKQPTAHDLALAYQELQTEELRRQATNERLKEWRVDHPRVSETYTFAPDDLVERWRAVTDPSTGHTVRVREEPSMEDVLITDRQSWEQERLRAEERYIRASWERGRADAERTIRYGNGALGTVGTGEQYRQRYQSAGLGPFTAAALSYGRPGQESPPSARI